MVFCQTWLLFSFAVFTEDLSVCALPRVQYAKGSSQASSWLSSGPQQLTSHSSTQCHTKRWSVPPLAWCLHLAQLGPDEDPWEPFQHWKRGLAAQTGGLYALLNTTVVHDLIGYPLHLFPQNHPNTCIDLFKPSAAIHCSVFLCSLCRCIALYFAQLVKLCSTAINEATFTWSGQLPPRHYQNPIYSCKVFLGGVPWDITEGRGISVSTN